MASTVQITGGAFQDSQANILANGYLQLSLSQDAQVSNQEIGSGQTIEVPLDSSGSVVTSPAVYIWPNDVLSPSGTFYNVRAYSAAGQLVWGPCAQQIFSSPSPYDIGAWVPGAVSLVPQQIGNITGLIEAGTNVTFTGSGTVSSPYVVSSEGGGGSGTVTSVGVSVPSWQTVSGSPITDSGTLAISDNDQSTNSLFAGPSSGSAAAPTFRSLVAADLPTATTSAQGAIKPDGSTITISGETISAVGSAVAITALTGDVTATGPGSATATLASVNADPGTVGSTSAVPVITSDAKGRITATSTAALGTMATQNASDVSITGGTVDGTPIGGTTKSSGNFTTVETSGNITCLGQAIIGNQATQSSIIGTDVALTGENSAGSPTWSFTNATGAAKVTTLAVGGSQALSGVQGTTGTSLAAANGTFTSGNLVATDASGNLVDTGIAKPTSALGTMASQNASAVAVTGGTVNGTAIGATMPANGTFSKVYVSGTQTTGNYAGRFIDSGQNQLVAQTTNTGTDGYTVFRLMDSNGTSMQFAAGGSGSSLYKTFYIYSEYGGGTLFSVYDNGSGNGPTVKFGNTLQVLSSGALNFVTAPTATSATAGSASALPATPTGYLEMQLNGTTIKLPYYSN